MITLVVLWLLAIFETSSAEEENKTRQPAEVWHGYSVAFHLLLPVAGFCILWGRRDLLNKLLLHVDRNCVSVFCPSFSKRQKLLKWAVENLPTTWSSTSKTLSGGIPDLWKDGSLMCTLINMAIPGACQNPPKHWKKPPTHAQALAYKYLGITPVFRESDFRDPLTPNQERKFLVYLQELQQAIKSRGYKEFSPQISQNYLAKGMGLHNGEQYKKTTFYVYSNTKTSNCSNILIYIRGPYDTQGTATIPAFFNSSTPSNLSCLHKQYKSMDKIVFKKEARRSFLKSIALDFSSLVNFDSKSISNDIPIHVDIETDRARISYIPLNHGIYEINLITNGELLVNSPFAVSISKNAEGARESFDTTAKILQQLPSLKKKRIVSRFIDCIDEKIPLDKDDSGVFSTSDERCCSQLESSILDEIEEPDSSNISQTQSELDTDSTLKSIDALDNSTASIENTVKFEKRKVNRLLPILSVTEPDMNITEEPENYELNSPKIVNDCHINLKVANGNQTISTPEKGDLHDQLEILPPGSSENSTGEYTTRTQSININESSSEILTDQMAITESHKEASETPGDENYLNIGSDDVVLKVFKVSGLPKPNHEPSCTEDPVQKRPTSIVSPFLINHSIEKPLERFTEGINNQEPLIDREDMIKPADDICTPDKKMNDDISHPRKLILAKNLENSYVERLKAILINKLTESENTKTIKNLVNTSNKLKSIIKFPNQQDENNNSFDEYSPRYASPICPVHIVPEVEPSRSEFSVAEKRKLFSRQSCLSIPSSNNSSFSEKENEDVAKELSEKCSLRLLSVIDTIRNSTNSSLSRTISKSTPNISISKSSQGSTSGESKSSFLEAREYWRTLSSKNSSKESSNSSKAKTKHLYKPVKISCDKYKSAEDISSISKMSFNRRLTKFSSLNQKDFEAIEFISLEERKKMLLQDQYEKEKMINRYVNKKVFARAKSAEINFKIPEASEEVKEIRRHFVATIPSEITAQILKPPDGPEIVNTEQKEASTASQFKRAITFFKNLEKSAYRGKKMPPKPKPEIKRRFSLDFLERKRNKTKVGGSLRLPKTSEKFSINRIYFDIVDNKRGSFRGAPNKEALSDTLSSLSSKTDELLNRSEGPIQYNMFLNKAKPKKRKSLKSVFNIHY